MVSYVRASKKGVSVIRRNREKEAVDKTVQWTCDTRKTTMQQMRNKQSSGSRVSDAKRTETYHTTCIQQTNGRLRARGREKNRYRIGGNDAGKKEGYHNTLANTRAHSPGYARLERKTGRSVGHI